MRTCVVSFILATLSVAGMSAKAVPAYAGPVKAEEYHVRGGIGHVMEKIREGKPVRIAYFGGSITEMDGWRRLSREWLQGEYPSCSFSEIQAAIGGTGSSLGVYRFGQDVLDKDPDLIFVEFATNDANESPVAIWRYFEGIVRQAWRRNPEIDIIFVYTITANMVDDYGNGVCPQAASAMEQLADHFDIPSICFGPRVVADVKTGKLVMTIGEVETAVPEETPDRDQVIIAELAKEGKVLFSKDGTHPVLPGHAYYLESIKTAWAQMENAGPEDHADKLSTPFYDVTMEAAKMVAIEPWMLSGSWRQVEADEPNGNFAGRFGGKPWLTETPGSKLKFRFRGIGCQLYGLVGPACGQLWISADGKRRSQSPVPLFDSYCTYYRVGNLSVFGGSDSLHEVEIELDQNQPSRQSVAFRLEDPEKELASDKYNGTEWYVGRIMLIGDVQPPSGEKSASTWFDANVEEYLLWPQDLSLAYGGQWTADEGEVSDAVALVSQGVLELRDGGPRLVFRADESKDLSTGREILSVVSKANLGAYDLGNLPPVEQGSKGGVVVVSESGQLNYYGMIGGASGNVWARLEGPSAAEGDPETTVRMTFKSEKGFPFVNYNINGVDYCHQGKKDIPISWVGAMGRVCYGGEGRFSSLASMVERTPLGLIMMVR